MSSRWLCYKGSIQVTRNLLTREHKTTFLMSRHSGVAQPHRALSALSMVSTVSCNHGKP